MGQKVSPVSLRLGIVRNWDSSWFSARNYAGLLHQDCAIRTFLKKRLEQAGIARIAIERMSHKVSVSIHTARPGVVIGKKGGEIEKVRAQLSRLVGVEVSLNIVELRKPETDAVLVAEGIANQIEKRVGFRRAIKRAIQSSLRLGAMGIRVNCSGRLGGAEIARMEWYREGRVPLHTLRADVDYGACVAKTTYGTVGVKVWIFKGELYNTSSLFLPKRIGERAGA
ncbi:MAG: 30S ribosomal protein S3 [Holosporales bacterium]|jgi:small subunit ribosomal protein S3|nr:30S ribosomal protein S3 [Holosporales bacterium]